MKTIHRVARLLLMLLVVMWCVCPVYAGNEEYDVWDGSVSAVTPSGTVYTVSSAAQLAWIAQQNDIQSGFVGCTIVLEANIDLNGSNRMRIWTPIGSAVHPFAGVLDGGHHLLRGLGSINAEDGVGLFGHVASSGVIKDLGLSGGRIIAVGQRRVGALAGVNAGRISGCWSQVEIAMADNVIGGLVGEMLPGSSLNDAYCCGLIRNASDTVGVLIGKNAGSLTRAYTTGYAKNGCAFVGSSQVGASYTKCFYDRKLYFQEPGVLNSGLIAINDTYKMFKCMQGESGWTTNLTRYPELTGFVGSDASRLSTVAAYVDTTCTNPVNHANDLTVSFMVDTTGGVRWSTQELAGSEWIAFTGSIVTVTRPCAETDVLTSASLRDETKSVYFRPRRVEELKEGEITPSNQKLTICWDDVKNVKKLFAFTPAKEGWGQHHYMIVRFGYDTDGDVYPLDTICSDKIEADFLLWFNTQGIKGDSVGDFLLRAYVHDERCVPDWIPCKGECNYSVLPEFTSGAIPSRTDTMYMQDGQVTIDVTALEPAFGGDGNFTYSWRTGVTNIVAHTENLSGYVVTTPGLYHFIRNVKDGSNCGNADSKGRYVVRVFDSLNVGEVLQVSKQMFCSLEDAQAYTVKATAATGGSNSYLYQWYIESGSTLTPIADATDCNLPLNMVTMVVGGDYTFVRMAKDNTRFTEWTRCAKSQSVHVMLDLVPGSIASADYGHNCLTPDASGTATAMVTISETNQPTGESPIRYRWLRINGAEQTIVGTDASLNYEWTIDESNSFIQYTYVREVKHGNCDWVRSAGQVTEEYGLKDKGELLKTVCVSQVPFTMHWSDSQGNDFSHTFTANGETWEVTDNYNPKGCPADTIISINVVERPEINAEKEAKFCQEENQITLYYDQTSGVADMFYILYSSELAKCMGRKDTMGYIVNPGTIVVRNVPPLPDAEMYMDVQVGVSGGAYSLAEVECYSPVTRVMLEHSLGGYVHHKFSRVLFVDNNPKNGEVPEPKLHFKEYQWYKNNQPIEGQVGQYYQENGNELKGIYYVIMKDDVGNLYRSCDYAMPQELSSVSALVPVLYPVPANAGEPVVVSCFGGSVDLCTCTGEVVLHVDCPEDSVTIQAPLLAGLYYVCIRHTDGTTRTEKLIVK